ncbi:MAG: flagellar hook-length control protein FliK [Phycisphaerae bacterium]|nr:flagellar hook-length control protein FliK [Phycisphaerae bacterium]
MNVALNNLIMPASAAATSGEVSSKPKHSASGKADKTAKPEVKSTQAGNSANSKDAPDTTKKTKAHIGPKAPDGKAAKVKKGEKIVVEAMGSGQVFSEIIQSAQASGKVQQVAGGESIAKALTEKDVGNPDIVLAGKAQVVKADTGSAQERASILGKTQITSATNIPAPEGQAVVASEIVGETVGGNTVGEMPLNAEPTALPSHAPIKITEALADVVSPNTGAEIVGKSQVGLEAPEVNQQVLASPAGPVLPALAEGMKQVSDATRIPAPVAGEKNTQTASSVTGREVVSTAGLTPNTSAEADNGTDAGIKIDTLLQGSDAPVVAVGQRQAEGSETSQEVMQHLGTTAEPVRVDTVDTPTVPSETSLPSPAANQVVEALRASAARQGNQVVIHLNPPELGKVSVRLSVTGNEVRGVLRVENPQTLTQLQREAPALLNRLAEAGVQLRQMDLSLSEQGSGDSSLYSQLRDESGLWNQNNQGDNSQPTASELLSDEHVLVGVEETGREVTTLADDAINVWI